MRSLIISVTVGLTALAGGCKPKPPPAPAAKPVPTAGEFPDEKLTVGGAERAYRLVVPDGLDLSRPVPLVVAFHGMVIDSKDVMPQYTKLPDAARGRFIVAFPNAVGGSWGIDAKKVKADLAFFDALLADVKARYPVDPTRVYVLGMSNGGYFAHTVARERSGIVAACASHSGTLGLEVLFGINAARKFPVLIVHGDKDNIMKVEWARENRDKYRREGHEVKYVEVPGLGHEWATKQQVNDAIWEFFDGHPMR